MNKDIYIDIYRCDKKDILERGIKTCRYNVDPQLILNLFCRRHEKREGDRLKIQNVAIRVYHESENNCYLTKEIGVHNPYITNDFIRSQGNDLILN